MFGHILIYGGTFDPFHNGHLSMVVNAHDKSKANRTIIVPTYGNPEKQQSHVFSDETRVSTIRHVVKKIPDINVSNSDIVNKTTRTIDTVRRYKKKNTST